MQNKTLSYPNVAECRIKVQLPTDRVQFDPKKYTKIIRFNKQGRFGIHPYVWNTPSNLCYLEFFKLLTMHNSFTGLLIFSTNHERYRFFRIKTKRDKCISNMYHENIKFRQWEKLCLFNLCRFMSSIKPI